MCWWGKSSSVFEILDLKKNVSIGFEICCVTNSNIILDKGKGWVVRLKTLIYNLYLKSLHYLNSAQLLWSLSNGKKKW